MRDSRLGIAVQQLLAVRHRRRVDGVRDGRPQRAAQEHKGQRRPEGVREQADERVVEVRVALAVEAAVRRHDQADEREIHKRQVEECHKVEQDAPETAEHALAELRVTLVERRAQRTRRLEGLRLTAEPGGQDEGADDAQRNVRRHPELVSRTALAGVVSGGDEEHKLAQAVADDGREAAPDEPSQLLVVGVGHQRLAHDQDDGDGEERNGEQDGVHAERRVEETREALREGHLLDLVAVKTELELERRVDSSNGPSGSLLEMTTVILRDGSELKRLVNIGSLPALSEHQRRRSDIFGERTKREVADLVEGLATHNVAGSSAPGHAEGVLDGLNDVDEEVETLGEGIRRRRVVEELGGTGESHLWVDEQVRKDSTEPVSLGNLSQLESGLCFKPLRGITISASSAAMNCPAPPGRRCIWSRPLLRLPALK